MRGLLPLLAVPFAHGFDVSERSFVDNRARVRVLVEVPDNANLPMAAMAQARGEFDVLEDEPDLHTDVDVIKRYRLVVDFGAIALNAFPSTDMSGAKKRPVTVISRDNDRRRRHDGSQCERGDWVVLPNIRPDFLVVGEPVRNRQSGDLVIGVADLVWGCVCHGGKLVGPRLRCNIVFRGLTKHARIISMRSMQAGHSRLKYKTVAKWLVQRIFCGTKKTRRAAAISSEGHHEGLRPSLCPIRA